MFISKPSFLISLSEVQSAWRLAYLRWVVHLVTIGPFVVYMRSVQVHVFPCMYMQVLRNLANHFLASASTTLRLNTPAFAFPASECGMVHKMATAVLLAPRRVTQCQGHLCALSEEHNWPCINVAAQSSACATPRAWPGRSWAGSPGLLPCQTRWGHPAPGTLPSSGAAACASCKDQGHPQHVTQLVTALQVNNLIKYTTDAQR